jgi:hypothetical protein
MSQCHGFATSAPFVRLFRAARLLLLSNLAPLMLFPLPSSLACEALQALYEPVDLARIDAGGIVVTQDTGRLRMASIWMNGTAEDAGTLALLKAVPPGSVLEAARLGDADRWGRTPADLVLTLPDGTRHAYPDEAIAAGSVFVWPSLEENDPCFAGRIALETAARRARRGIWANKDIIINSTSPTLSADAIGRPALALGKVEAVVFRRSAAYINFGHGWRNRLSVIVPMPKRKARREAMISAIKGLAGRNILLRGMIEAGRDAPRMLITDERQISIEDGQGK